MSERATQPQQLNGEVTDEHMRLDTPTVDDVERDSADDDAVFAAIPRKASFEHRRVISNARRKLFGRGKPAQIGRYRIQRRLGVGGMGEVYLAHDDDLGRQVAIKRVLGSSANERDQERLRREARALARLSHANVVQVYEVGEHEQRTFVAMEFVDGETVSVWLAEQPRPWRAVLERFLAAGRGLAAAHEAGLVHRDFKPDNVLLSADGSVRVADFGLALAGEERRPFLDDGAGRELSADMRLSVTGAIRGTIRYMPLEQLLGEQVDARSDQFAFCVALYEALWNAPPFSVASSSARLRDLGRGIPTPPSHRGRARPPVGLWRIIRRGLSKDPEARWPDMGALLEALDGVTRRRRRLAWFGSATAAVAVTVGALVLTREPAVDPCAAVERELEGTWDNERRTALERGLASLGGGDVEAGHAVESRERVLAGLDRWASSWVGEREQVCRESAELRVDPELSRLQSACLTRQRQQVQDLVELLLAPGSSAGGLAAAVEAVAELPAAAACEDELALLGVKPPPLAIADEVEVLRREVVRAQELRLLGRVDEGLTLAEQTERAAGELGYGPLVAEALGELAKAEIVGGSLVRGTERMQEAIDEAERNHHDYLAADLWTELALRSLSELDDAEAGAAQLRRAEVANDRVEASARAQARLAFARGQLSELRGDVVGAELAYRAAIAQAEEDEASAPELPSYQSNLARLVSTRDLTEAIALSRSAVQAANRAYGPQHPQTATLLYDLAVTLRRSDPDNEEVVELLEQAAQIWTQTHGRPHRDLAKAELLLGKLALQRHDLDAAESHARALASIQAQILPRGHRDHGDTAHLLATVYGIRGDNEMALAQARIALAAWEPNYGPNNLGVLRLRSQIATLLLALGRLDDADEELDALLPRAHGSPEFVAACLQSTELALRRGQTKLADAELAQLDELEPKALGGHDLSYALLRALIAHRRGELQPVMLTRLQQARSSTPFTPEQIETWIEHLDIDVAERAALGLSLVDADISAGASTH
ncbi:serine/threonine-protein kinase [Enhygromyxa salina]|nr:serine/threonine-protein kinase [Enhygromyxa salina]